MRAQQSAQVHADAERITIQLQRNAAAESTRAPGTRRFVIDAGVEPLSRTRSAAPVETLAVVKLLRLSFLPPDDISPRNRSRKTRLVTV